MTRLKSLSIPGFDAARDVVVDFDMDGLGRHVAVLRSADGTRVVTEQGELGLPPKAAHRVGTARLLPGGRVLVDPVAPVTDAASESCGIVSAERFEVGSFGVPHDMFTAGDWAFATYDESTMLSVREPSFEADVVTVFNDASSCRLFGLSDILARRREEPDAYAVTAGCATRAGEFTFVAFGSVWLWTLNAASRTYRAVQPQVTFEDSEEVEALAVDGPAAVLMFARRDGLELAWADRGTGECLRRESVPLATLADYVQEPVWQRPAGNWGLNARVRGMDGGRFLLCLPRRVLLLETTAKVTA